MENNYIYIITYIAIVVFMVNIYNSIVKLHTTTDVSLSDINILLKKRFDLIPLLIDTVKGYMKYEQERLHSALDYLTPDEVCYESTNNKCYNVKEVLLKVA